MTTEIPESAQQPGETLADWIKRRDKAAKDKIEERELEDARILEEKRLETERLDKIKENLKQPLRLHPPYEEETAPDEAAREGIEEVLEEIKVEPKRIRVPEGFEVTRFIYDKDGEPTAVYIDRMRPFNWRTMAIGVILGAVISLLLTAFMILPPWEIFNWGGL